MKRSLWKTAKFFGEKILTSALICSCPYVDQDRRRENEANFSVRNTVLIFSHSVRLCNSQALSGAFIDTASIHPSAGGSIISYNSLKPAKKLFIFDHFFIPCVCFLAIKNNFRTYFPFNCFVKMCFS